MPDEDGKPGEDHRLRTGPRLRPEEGHACPLRNAGVHGTGSYPLRPDPFRHGHVEHRSHVLRSVSQ